MNHEPFPRDPLTPEEQALARRLGQLGPHGEPSPALDARVLAAARAAGATPARRVRRWPVALGVAASLVLAVGIAWRLRPLPAPAVEEGMASTPPAPAAPAVDDAGAGGKAAEVGVPPPNARAGVASAHVTREPAPDDERAPAAAAFPAEPPAAVTPAPVPSPAPTPPAPEPAVVLDVPAPAAAALPPPPPPAPPAADARALQPQAAAGTPAPLARKAAPPAAQAQEDAGFDAAAAANAASGDEPPEDVPPATADAPAVRDAWLQRIRELLAEGQVDAARTSLKEFVHRHPDAPLPDDLRALAK